MTKRDEHNVTVNDIIKLYTSKRLDIEKIKKVASVPALLENWRSLFLKRLESVK